MKCIKFLLLLISMLLTECVSAQFTLQQCIATGIQNNTNVLQKQFGAAQNKVNAQQAKAGMLPSVNANITHSLYNGRSINPYTNSYINQQNTTASWQLGASVTLWNAGSIRNYMRYTALVYDASKAEYQQAIDQLTFDIILNYLSILSTQEQLKVAEEQVLATGKKVEQLDIRNQEGNIAPSDLYDMRGQLSSAKMDKVAIKNSLEKAKLSLAQLMSIPYDSAMTVKKLDEENTLMLYDARIEQIYETALNTLGVVKAADIKQEVALRDVSIAKGQLWPVLSLSGGVYTNYSSAAAIQNEKIPYNDQWKNNINSAVNVGLQIPLFNNMRTKAKLQQTKIVKVQASVVAKNTRIELRQSIERDYVNMKTAYDTYLQLIDMVNNYRQSFRAAEIKYDAGAMSTVEYVIVKNNLDRAALNLISAKYDYILKTKILDYYQGKQFL